MQNKQLFIQGMDIIHYYCCLFNSDNPPFLCCSPVSCKLSSPHLYYLLKYVCLNPILNHG